MIVVMLVSGLLLSGCKKDDKETPSGDIPGTFTDPRDGQTYKVVTVGDQVWFAENLNYESPDSWWYDNSSAIGDTYGRLYIWDAALTACPGGWHLPSEDEWNVLINHLGNPAGGKLKEEGYAHWKEPNIGATNEIGFTALPGGLRTPANYEDLGEQAYFYTSKMYYSNEGNYARFMRLTYNDHWVSTSGGFLNGWAGASVRCLKD